MPTFSFLDFLLSLIITITVYSLPIIIARYVVIRRPIERKTAKIICAVYAFFGLAIMTMLVHLIDGEDATVTGGGLLLWSYVNYKLLTTGADRRKSIVVSASQTMTLPHDYDSNLTAPQPAAAPKVGDTQRPSSSKETYCKRCGSLISSKAKTCTGCGKQYFYLSKRLMGLALACLVFAGLIGLNVYQYNTNSREIQRVTNELEELKKIYDNQGREYIKRVNDLHAELISQEADHISQKTELVFWRNEAVICTTAGTKYHHYGCSQIEGGPYYIFNTESAKARGYRLCLDCAGALELMMYKAK